jgi:hypothetical protein
MHAQRAGRRRLRPAALSEPSLAAAPAAGQSPRGQRHLRPVNHSIAGFARSLLPDLKQAREDLAHLTAEQRFRLYRLVGLEAHQVAAYEAAVAPRECVAA